MGCGGVWGGLGGVGGGWGGVSNVALSSATFCSVRSRFMLFCGRLTYWLGLGG